MRAPLFVLVWSGLRHPKCAWRYFRGLSPSSIDHDEILPLVRDDGIVVEAGAADGSDTLVFAEHCVRGRVYALEPVNHLYNSAVARLAAFSNVDLLNSALATEGEDTLQLFVDDAEGHSSSVREPTRHLSVFSDIHFPNSQEVRAITLDQFVSERGIQRIDLLWLDLQGYELDVLRDGGRSALRMSSLVHLEVARVSLYRGAPTLREVKYFMHQNGFRPIIERVPIYFGNILFRRIAR